MRRTWSSSSRVGLVLVCYATAGAAAPLVEDAAGLMRVEQRTRLAEHHAYLLKDHDIDYRVVTRNDTGDINEFAVSRFEELGVGEASATGRGLLLVIDPAQDLVRLEVGYSLEGVYPDAFIAYIEHRQMVPFFRAGRVADGILATTELIVTRAQRAQANAGFEDEDWYAGSGGAGATTRARLGAGLEPRSQTAAPAAPAGPSPEATLTSFFAAMQARNGNPDLVLYTPATRRMLAGWIMTRAQMDNVVRTYRSCQAESARYRPDRRYAVIRYPPAQRQCAPFFFERIAGTWTLDLTMMQRAIRFGRSNAWRFDRAAEHPYGFAFEDWRFDRNGFPVAAN